MFTKIQNWSKIFALRIFRKLAFDDVQKSAFVPHWTLEQLVSGINDDNVHQEWATGNVTGHEIW